MEAIIKKIEYQKERQTRFGILHSFKITYGENKVGYYSCKTKDQTAFKVNEKATFVEETNVTDKGTFVNIKPEYSKNGYSAFSKAIAKEKSKYSGFAVSYSKDLIIAGKIDISQMAEYSGFLVSLMADLDEAIGK